MKITYVKSTANERVKWLRQLHTAKGREYHGMYLIEGRRLIHEALGALAPIGLLAVSAERLEDYAEEIQDAHTMGARIYGLDAHVMDKISATVQSQGIMAAVTLPPNSEISGSAILALDQLADPGNMGTIMRTAHAFGVDGIVVNSGCADPFAPKCVRAAMGAHFKLSLSFTSDLPDLLRRMKRGGYQVVGGHLRGFESMPQLHAKRILVIGSEARGLSDEVALECTDLFRIPMVTGAESLNAAVAAGILLYQLFGHA